MTVSLPAPERVKKIGVLRAGSLGQFFLSFPALHALRQHYPKAKLIFFGDEWHQTFLSQHPELVDRIEVLPLYYPFEKRRQEPALQDFIARMRKEKFDLILQMQDDGHDSNPLVLAMEPKASAGFAAVDAEPLELSMPYVLHQHEVLRPLELLEQVGILDYTLDPRWPVARSDHSEYSEYYKPDGRELVILHPGAHDPRRQWPPEFFGEVGDWLVGQGYRVLITSNIVEYTVAESVLYTMKQPAEALVGVLSLPSLVALLSRARLVICNDSGPLHVARAVGIPTIGLYWGLNLLHSSPLFATRHRALVDWQDECPVCGARDLFTRWPTRLPTPSGCTHDRSMIGDIKAQDVISEAESLLLDTVKTRSL